MTVKNRVLTLENTKKDTFKGAILREPVENRAAIIKTVLASKASMSKAFGNLADIFPEVIVEDLAADLPAYHYPVFYKVFLPSGKTVGQVNYFYVFSYIRKEKKALNVYFQSAAVSDRSQTQSGYSLSSGAVRFEALKSAFTDTTASFVSISDPGHFCETHRPAFTSVILTATSPTTSPCLWKNC